MKDCLPCAALALVEAVQKTLLKKDAILIDFPMETIGDVLRIIEHHPHMPQSTLRN